jgi:tetratricopeptide (TPR) repeat protein
LEVKAVQSELSTYREALTAAREGINEYHAGDFEAAVRSYDSALRLDPSNANLLDLKGYSLFKAGKLEESVAALQSSVEADPHYAWGYFDLARTYCAMRKFPEAAKAADAAIRADSALRRHMDADGEFRRVCKPILARVLQ